MVVTSADQDCQWIESEPLLYFVYRNISDNQSNSVPTQINSFMNASGKNSRHYYSQSYREAFGCIQKEISHVYGTAKGNEICAFALWVQYEVAWELILIFQRSGFGGS